VATTDARRLHLGLEDQVEQRYQRVPFEVGPAWESVEVVLDYDDSAAVIDLGCEGAAGWRGWSGGARRSFVIGPTEATPGYLPGELEAGSWHVVLGLHVVPARPIEVRVEIRHPACSPLQPQPDVAPGHRPPTVGSLLPAPAGTRWLAGDFHAHTVHSDGSDTVDALAALAVAAGLDFLAVTDHNTVSHHACLPAVSARHGIHLLPGQEVTTARGHANAFGAIGWVDFRQPAQWWVDTVERRGGLLSINHPIEADCAWQHPLTTLPTAVELWHSSWLRAPQSTAVWAHWQRWTPDAVPIGGSDFHGVGRGAGLGSPVTWVAAEELSTEAILGAVRAGRTAISLGCSPGSAVMVRHEDDLVVLGGDSGVLVDSRGRRKLLSSDRKRVPLSWGEGVVHLEDADRRLLALC
jgi:hypothetical protein